MSWGGKAKKREFARWHEGVLPGRRCYSHVVSISSSYSGNGGAKFSKKIWLLLEFDRIGGLVRVRAFSNEALSVVSREQFVKRLCIGERP